MKQVIMLILILGIGLHANIRNEDKPAKGEWKAGLEKLAELECAGDYFFGGISDIKTDKTGRIFISDHKNSKIYIFDKNGNFVKAFGKKGEGPGEFKQLGDLHIVEDFIVVEGRSQLVYFDNDGKYVKTVKINQDLTPRFFINKDKLISAPRVPRGGKKSDKLKLEVYNIKDGTRSVLCEYSAFDEATISKKTGEGQMVVSMIVGGVTPLMLVSQHNGTIYYGMNDIYKINRIDMKGKSKGAISLEGRDKLPFPDEKKKEIFGKVKGIPEATVKRLIAGIPGEATYYDSVEFDAKGNMYVFLSEPVSNSGAKVDIFSPEGKYMYRCNLKFGEDIKLREICMNGDRLIVGVENEDGEYEVGLYKINLP